MDQSQPEFLFNQDPGDDEMEYAADSKYNKIARTNQNDTDKLKYNFDTQNQYTVKAGKKFKCDLNMLLGALKSPTDDIVMNAQFSEEIRAPGKIREFKKTAFITSKGLETLPGIARSKGFYQTRGYLTTPMHTKLTIKNPYIQKFEEAKGYNYQKLNCVMLVHYDLSNVVDEKVRKKMVDHYLAIGEKDSVPKTLTAVYVFRPSAVTIGTMNVQMPEPADVNAERTQLNKDPLDEKVLADRFQEWKANFGVIKQSRASQLDVQESKFKLMYGHFIKSIHLYFDDIGAYSSIMLPVSVEMDLLVRETGPAQILKQMWPKRPTYYTYKAGKVQVPANAQNPILDMNLIELKSAEQKRLNMMTSAPVVFAQPLAEYMSIFTGISIPMIKEASLQFRLRLSETFGKWKSRKYAPADTARISDIAIDSIGMYRDLSLDNSHLSFVREGLTPERFNTKYDKAGLQNYYKQLIDYSLVQKAKDLFTQLGKLTYAINSNSLTLKIGEQDRDKGNYFGKFLNTSIGYPFKFSQVNAMLCAPVGVTNSAVPNQFDLYKILKINMNSSKQFSTTVIDLYSDLINNQAAMEDDSFVVSGQGDRPKKTERASAAIVYELLENCFALAFVYNHRQYRDIPDIVAQSVVLHWIDAVLQTFKLMTQITADPANGAQSIDGYSTELEMGEAIKKGTSMYIHFGFMVLATIRENIVGYRPSKDGQPSIKNFSKKVVEMFEMENKDFVFPKAGYQRQSLLSKRPGYFTQNKNNRDKKAIKVSANQQKITKTFKEIPDLTELELQELAEKFVFSQSQQQ